MNLAKVLFIEEEGWSCDMCNDITKENKGIVVCIDTLGCETIDICYNCLCNIKKQMED